MHAKTVKKTMYICTQSCNKLFHIGRYIGRFIGRYQVIYWPIFQITAVSCYKRYGERFPHIVSAAGKKGDIDRYLGRLGRCLKQGNHLLLECIITISMAFPSCCPEVKYLCLIKELYTMLMCIWHLCFSASTICTWSNNSTQSLFPLFSPSPLLSASCM